MSTHLLLLTIFVYQLLLLVSCSISLFNEFLEIFLKIIDLHLCFLSSNIYVLNTIFHLTFTQFL